MRVLPVLFAGLLSCLLLLNAEAIAQLPSPLPAGGQAVEQVTVGEAAADSLSNQLVAELEQHLAGAQVVRVPQGIRLTFITTTLFAPGHADLRPAAQGAIGQLATVLQQYPLTPILVTAYPDSSAGTTRSSYSLAQRRARAVRSVAMSRGVRPELIQAQAYEASQSVDSNGPTNAGRVEITLGANSSLGKVVRADSL